MSTNETEKEQTTDMEKSSKKMFEKKENKIMH